MHSFEMNVARWRTAHIFVHSPLVRISDRIEAAVLIAVVGILLVAVPMAEAVGTAADESSSRSLAAQAPTSRKVTATAIKDSVQNMRYSTGSATAWARWQINGGQHTGHLRWDRPRVRTGDRMEICVNLDGQRITLPSPTFHAVAVGAGSWLSCVAGFAIMRLRLNHIRLAGWEREVNSLEGDDGRGHAHP